MTRSKQTIESLIREYAEHTPDKIAVIDENGNRISYSALWNHILNAAGFLLGLGLKKGERIVLAASKSVDFINIYFGAHLIGAVAVPVDPEVNASRLDRIVNLTEPRLIIGELRHAGELKVTSFKDIMTIENEKGKDNLILPLSQNIADILFTTGTTGIPKGVVLTNGNELQAAENINKFIGNTSDDIEILALPVSHSFGLGRIRCVFSKGGTLVIVGSFASMKKFFGTIEKYKATGFGMVPASWAYISRMSGDKLGSFANQLKYIEIGSAPMPLAEKRRLMALLPDTKICMHYGLTEASRSAFISFHEESEHLETAGKASPNCDIAVFDADGNRLNANCDGEVCVKGDHVCSSYWQNDETYRNDFFDGYFRTGDWGCLDEEGYLHLKSRTREIINVGGKKVSPMEVEEALESIEGVTEAACIGVSDPVMGQVVVAFVTSQIDENKEKEIIKTMFTLVENYKVPVSVKHVDSLPRTSSGKLQRLKLKEEFYGR